MLHFCLLLKLMDVLWHQTYIPGTNSNGLPRGVQDIRPEWRDRLHQAEVRWSSSFRQYDINSLWIPQHLGGCVLWISSPNCAFTAANVRCFGQDIISLLLCSRFGVKISSYDKRLIYKKNCLISLSWMGLFSLWRRLFYNFISYTIKTFGPFY